MRGGRREPSTACRCRCRRRCLLLMPSSNAECYVPPCCFRPVFVLLPCSVPDKACLGFNQFKFAPSQGLPPCRPAISNLVAHISQHLSSPDGNPQLALTFQPLVNMALHMQASIPSRTESALRRGTCHCRAVGKQQLQPDWSRYRVEGCVSRLPFDRCSAAANSVLHARCFHGGLPLLLDGSRGRRSCCGSSGAGPGV